MVVTTVLPIELKVKPKLTTKPETIAEDEKKLKDIKLPQITAIVDNNILIDNRWLQEGDYYDKFQIIKIDIKNIKLKYNNQIYRIQNEY